MPTRKQRRRLAKEKRHEYEFVYVDGEGNELDEAPEGLEEAKPKASRNGAQASSKSRQPQRGGRRREPQPPSWQRAAKRALMLGAVVFILFSFSTKGGGNHYVSALIPALIYTALFVPFTYAIDRFAYRRWQARQESGSSNTRSAKKR